MADELDQQSQALERQQFEFVMQQYAALRAEITDRMARVTRLVYLLLSGALVYVTVIFVPLFGTENTNSTLPLWTAIMASAEDNPLLLMLMCLTLFVPILCFAIEAIITAETDGIARAGIFIRDNIEGRIITSKNDGWENWLDFQDTSFGRRTSENLARTARFLIIALYCVLTAMIGGFAANHFYGPDGFAVATPAILAFYAVAGTLVFVLLRRTQASELVAPSFDAVIVDLDGCLLDSSGQISSTNLAAVQRLKRKNITVVVATGRAAEGTWKYLDQLKLEGPHAVSNGACLATWPDKSVEVLSALPAASLNTLTRRLTEAGILWVGFSSGDLFCLAQDKVFLRDQLIGRNDITEKTTFKEIEEINTWDWHGRPQISKLWCPVSSYEGERRVQLEQIGAEVSLHIDGVRTTNDTYEFFCKGVDKVDGVKEILRRHGQEDKPTLALGDQNNDLKLLEWATEAFAPSNASPDVRKQLGSLKINKTNDEDFVAEVVRLRFDGARL